MTENDILRSSSVNEPSDRNNESQGLIYEFSDIYGKVHLPLTFTICIFGGITNVLNIVVMTRRHMITPSNVLLTGMSIAQFCLAVNYLSLITYTILAENCCINGAFYSYSWTVYKWINVNLSVAFHTTALAHTTFLSIFRYIAINKPHFSQAYLNVVTCKRCILLIHLLTPLLCSPTFFITSIDKISEPNCNLKVAYELRYSAGKGLWQTTLWIFGVVCKLIPSSAIAVFSLNLIFSLKKFDTQRERLNKTSKDHMTRKNYQQRLSKMLLMVAVLCVSVEIPHGLLQVLTAVFGADFGVDVYDNLGDFFEMLTLLYNSINFILYCLMSSEFQKTFRQLIYNPLKSMFCCNCYSSNTMSRDTNAHLTMSLDSRRFMKREFV